jgi:hypothetical protein
MQVKFKGNKKVCNREMKLQADYARGLPKILNLKYLA